MAVLFGTKQNIIKIINKCQSHVNKLIALDQNLYIPDERLILQSVNLRLNRLLETIKLSEIADQNLRASKVLNTLFNAFVLFLKDYVFFREK